MHPLKVPRAVQAPDVSLSSTHRTSSCAVTTPLAGALSDNSGRSLRECLGRLKGACCKNAKKEGS